MPKGNCLVRPAVGSTLSEKKVADVGPPCKYDKSTFRQQTMNKSDDIFLTFRISGFFKSPPARVINFGKAKGER